MPHRKQIRESGPFEAISRTPSGKVLRTRHHSALRAMHRLVGNRRHTEHALIEHVVLENGTPATRVLTWGEYK